MVERSEVYELAQIGVQTVSGTGVPATRKLSAMGLDLRVGENTDTFTPMGEKYPTVIVPNREWSQVGVTGKPTYTEMIYPLAAFMQPTIPLAPIGGSTTSYQWLFDSDPAGPDATKLFTLEKGSSVRAAKAIDTFMKSMGFTISKMRGTSLKGELMGRSLVDGITITPGLSAVGLIPMTPADFCVYVDTTAAADFGTTKLGRVFDYDTQINNKQDGVFVLDCAAGTTYSAVVETKPSPELTLVVEADAAGMAFLAGYRNQTTYYIRIEGTGPLIEAGHNYSFRWDCACRVNQPQQFKGEQGVYAIGFRFSPIKDAVWGKAFQARIINNLATL